MSLKSITTILQTDKLTEFSMNAVNYIFRDKDEVEITNFHKLIKDFYIEYNILPPSSELIIETFRLNENKYISRQDFKLYLRLLIKSLIKHEYSIYVRELYDNLDDRSGLNFSQVESIFISLKQTFFRELSKEYIEKWLDNVRKNEISTLEERKQIYRKMVEEKEIKRDLKQKERDKRRERRDNCRSSINDKKTSIRTEIRNIYKNKNNKTANDGNESEDDIENKRKSVGKITNLKSKIKKIFPLDSDEEEIEERDKLRRIKNTDDNLHEYLRIKEEKELKIFKLTENKKMLINVLDRKKIFSEFLTIFDFYYEIDSNAN